MNQESRRKYHIVIARSNSDEAIYSKRDCRAEPALSEAECARNNKYISNIPRHSELDSESRKEKE